MSSDTLPNIQANHGITYQDIRIHSPYKNTLILPGSRTNSHEIELKGNFVFATTKDITISSITVSLVGYYSVQRLEKIEDDDGKVLFTCPVFEQQCIYKAVWKNVLTENKGKFLTKSYDKQRNMKSRSIPVTSFSTETQRSSANTIPPRNSPLFNNFKPHQVIEFNDSIPFESTPFPSYNKRTNTNTSFRLSPGNYSFPFSISLPEDLPETVEGPKNCSIVYLFKSNIEFMNNGSKLSKTKFNKYVRIVRTLSSLQIALNEDFLVENSWVSKLQYKIRIPKKMLYIGESLKLYFLFMPLIKNLRLGKISVQIIQKMKCNSLSSVSSNDEYFTNSKVIYHQTLPIIPQKQLPQDVWALAAKLPTSNILSNCCPDIDSSLISIKHKMIIYISLINPDNHISQIKSKIPIGFFIKPNSLVYSKQVELASNAINFTQGFQKVFNVETKDIGKTQPEVLVSPVDELNPDSFLFGDETDQYISVDDGILSTSNLTHSTINSIANSYLNLNLIRCNNTNIDIPPPYKQSLSDAIFDPNEFSRPAAPVYNGNEGCSSFLRLNTHGSNGSNLSCHASNKRQSNECAPSYKMVFDEDASHVGEPSPLYKQNNSNISLINSVTLRYPTPTDLSKRDVVSPLLTSSAEKRLQTSSKRSISPAPLLTLKKALSYTLINRPNRVNTNTSTKSISSMNH